MRDGERDIVEKKTEREKRKGIIELIVTKLSSALHQ